MVPQSPLNSKQPKRFGVRGAIQFNGSEEGEGVQEKVEEGGDGMRKKMGRAVGEQQQRSVKTIEIRTVGAILKLVGGGRHLKERSRELAHKGNLEERPARRSRGLKVKRVCSA